jgi:hypothetical protein
MTYYLHKGESINFQGHNYMAHMTEFHYQVGQHDVADMEHALVDRGANGGICGNDMLVLEGSQCFVDVVGLAGHKVNQLQIVCKHWLLPTRVMLLPPFIKWYYWEKEIVSYHACKWKHMEQKSMIVHLCYLAENSALDQWLPASAGLQEWFTISSLLQTN